jgi:hypothetical protein
MDISGRDNWRDQVEIESQALEQGKRSNIFQSFMKFEEIPKGTKLSEIYSKIESKMSLSVG